MNSDYRFYASLIDKQKKIMYDAVDYIWKNPEIGYKEWKTSAYLENEFTKLGYEVLKPKNIPGFIAEFDTKREGATIAIMGELDALMCATHPDAHPETKAVHACGHLAQVATMLGIAAALKTTKAADVLSGKIRFIAVPAEETIDLVYRNGLIEKGIIDYMAGKIEFLKRGYFDGVDMAMMFHADASEDVLFKFIDGCDGCITKHFEYTGVAAHAGGAPHLGVNALYAASLGLQACNSLRETFQEKDYVRFHPIINQAGVAPNAIPSIASLDSYVRAASLEAIVTTNQKLNRALAGAAVALGANVYISDKPGNLPFNSDKMMTKQAHFIIEDLFGKGVIKEGGWSTQSSDVGDISSLMPVIQHLTMGASGIQHGEDYYITDREKAVVNPAKVMMCLIYDLLKEDASLAKKVKEAYVPLFKTKEAYFKSIDELDQNKQLVAYREDTIEITV